MAHPHLKDSRDGHNAKLKRMTDGYGLASGPANNKLAPDEEMKGGEGPEDAIGFGADSTKPRGRSDRASRKQFVANPVATLKHGGVSKRARGGRKGHGRTQVNVLVAPQHGAGAPGGAPVVPVAPVAGGMPPGPGLPPRPPGPPMGAGPMVPPPPMPGPMAPGAPGGIPPGVMPPRKRGGRVHGDEAEDKALIEKSLKKHHLVRKDGGSIGGMGGDEMMVHSRKEQGLKAPVVASDGKGRGGGKHMPGHHHMTAGAATGEGRLEKMGKEPKPNTQKQVV